MFFDSEWIRPVMVAAMAAGLSVSFVGCSGKDSALDQRNDSAGTSATVPDGQSEGEAEGHLDGQPGTSGGPATSSTEPASRGAVPGPADTSPIVDVKGTVMSVDTRAELIRLAGPDAGPRVIEVTSSTEYRLSEGEHAQLTDVVTGAVVVGTGLVNDGRLQSRLVTILTYPDAG